ncbi:MAG: YcaO-like family protein [Deltaproteobacteria bacterium]|nr:YcaO-like family protein [Deltaproteobacteria bacterium]
MSGPLTKRYREGTPRLVPPQETLERLRPLLPELGITRLANITGLDRIGIPVVMCCRPNSRSISVSQGKGLDLDAAKASAIMESLEGYHAERVRLPLMLSSYAELRATRPVVDVSRLTLSINGRYHPELPLLWVQGRDWMSGEGTWVPFQLVHTAYTADLRLDATCFAASSSGLASGNHLVEAVSHAICEVVERDARWRFVQRLPEEQESLRLDLSSVDDPHCRRLLDRFERAGVTVAAWEITAAVELPSFLAAIEDAEDAPFGRLYAAGGLGCHPVRQVALSRALSEAAQSRLTAISGARDDMPRLDDLLRNEARALERAGTLSSGRGRRAFAAAPSFEADSLEDDLEWELGALRKAGFGQVVVVDLTQAEIGIPVVRVIVPGLHRIGGRAPADGPV